MIDGMPMVNQELCIECGVCIIICPFQARDITDVINMIT
jgi:Fe-S-cluster-containing hydrogenase component 2